jgi:hypothetical protein
VVTIQNADRSQSTKGCKWVLRLRVHEVECDQAACVCRVDRGRRYEKSTTRKTKERRRRCNKSFVSHTTPTATRPPKKPASHTTFVLIQSQTPCCFSLFINYYFLNK